jgi:hypothetical protein
MQRGAHPRDIAGDDERHRDVDQIVEFEVLPPLTRRLLLERRGIWEEILAPLDLIAHGASVSPSTSPAASLSSD